MVKIFLTVTSLVLFLVFDQFLHITARIRGNIDAVYDLQHGNYRVLSYGLSGPWYEDAADLLQERYKIKNERVAGCIVTGSFVAYVRAYNNVSTAAANARFGHDVFAETSDEARENWLALHPPN